MQTVNTYSFKVAPGEMNAQSHLPLSLLLTKSLDIAGVDADQFDFGYEALHEKNCSWVLARFAIEMSRYPSAYEECQVETWVEGTNKHFSMRNFCYKTESGEILGYARSIWAMFDLVERKPIDLTPFFEELDRRKVEKECPILPPCKVTLTIDTPTEKYQIKAADIDMNRHVNSSRYVDHLLNLFPLEWHDQHRTTRLEINYLHEAYFADQVEFYKEPISEKEFLLEVRRHDGISHCKAKITFE